MSRYQKKHSPTHHPDHHPIFISFFHLLRSIVSSLFKLRAWQSFCTTSLHVLFGLPLGLEPSTSYSIHKHKFSHIRQVLLLPGEYDFTVCGGDAALCQITLTTCYLYHPPCEGAIIRERTCPGMPNDILPWAFQKWLNRSICRLGCGLGWVWRKHIFNHIRQVVLMCPHRRGHWSHLANTTCYLYHRQQLH